MAHFGQYRDEPDYEQIQEDRGEFYADPDAAEARYEARLFGE